MSFTCENLDNNVFLVYKMGKEEVVDRFTFGMMTNNSIPGILPVVYTQFDLEKSMKYRITSLINLKKFTAGIVQKRRLLHVLCSITEALLNAEEYMLDAASFIWDIEYIYIDKETDDAKLICLPIKQERQSVDVPGFFKQLIFSLQYAQNENNAYVTEIINYINSTGGFTLSSFHTLLRRLQNFAPREHALESHRQTNSPTPLIPQGRVPRSESQKLEDAFISQESEKEKKGLLGLFKSSSAKQKKEESKKSGALQNASHPHFAVPNLVQQESIPGIAVPSAKPELVIPSSPKKEEIKPLPVKKQNKDYTIMGGAISEGTILLSSADVDKEPDCTAYLLRRATNEKIYIKTEIFKIGKEKNYVDYCIIDNNTISRSHACISYSNHIFYIEDTNSKNHTYVNDTRLMNNVPVELYNGDRIRMSNEEFSFIIE